MNDWLPTLTLALGSAWTSGINLYATVTVLGLLQKFGATHLPGGLDVLDNWWIIGIAAFLYAIEFFADKIPYLDSVWDVIHTFIRVPAGAIVAWRDQSNGRKRPRYRHASRRRARFFITRNKSRIKSDGKHLARAGFQLDFIRNRRYYRHRRDISRRRCSDSNCRRADNFPDFLRLVYAEIPARRAASVQRNRGAFPRRKFPRSRAQGILIVLQNSLLIRDTF